MGFTSTNLLRFVTEGPSFWLPPQASTAASGVDKVFSLIFWVSAFFFALIIFLTILFVFRYRRRSAGETASPTAPTHNTALELTWTVIPLLIVFGIFYVGFKGFLDLSVAPGDAYEIQVTGMRWKWQFTYPNGYTDENLHAPVDTPVRLVLTSEDVIHSFYVPDFRLKSDVVPGRYSKAWFEATEPGEYQIFCAEYCGTGHSDMLASVIIHEPGGFEKWLAAAADFIDTMPLDQAGKRLYEQRGCAQCHSIDGSGKTGPTFKNLFGSTHLLTDRTEITVEEDYIRESILDPQAKLVAGYQPVMPTFQGRLRDKEITAIIAFLKSLREE